MPLTEAEKSARKRAKKEAMGLVTLSVYVKPQEKTDIKLYLSGKAKIVRINPLDEYDGRIY